eukprot:GHVH01004191.1.p1 GENE.GHVH01004191.1~~GHVH01004191.1.p1  ORF type:complete len:245 (-),score=35.87 GHVH01004191.1:98-832(-)
MIQDDILLLGVFDGVGHWTKFGIDPTDYSREFVDALIVRAVDRQWSTESITESLLLGLVEEAHECALGECFSNEGFGSTTVSLTLIKRDVLHTFNIGDSGTMVIRPGIHFFNSVFCTNSQRHSANTPYQIGRAPTLDECYDFGLQTSLSECVLDAPSEAEYASFRLVDGDIILMASDGLFDNMDEGAIESMIQSEVQKCQDPPSMKLMARAVAEEARRVALSGRGCMGDGKDDDITVVLCQYRK